MKNLCCSLVGKIKKRSTDTGKKFSAYNFYVYYLNENDHIPGYSKYIQFLRLKTSRMSVY